MKSPILFETTADNVATTEPADWSSLYVNEYKSTSLSYAVTFTVVDAPLTWATNYDKVQNTFSWDGVSKITVLSRS